MVFFTFNLTLLFRQFRYLISTLRVTQNQQKQLLTGLGPPINGRSGASHGYLNWLI